MKINKTMGKKVVTGMLIAGVLASAGSMAFASETTNKLFKGDFLQREAILQERGDLNSKQPRLKMQHEKLDPAAMQEKIEARLAEKVAAGEMTQEEADKKLEEMAAKHALMEEFKALAPEEKETFLSEKVTEGVITQEQADRMLKGEQMRALMEEYRALPQEERKTFLSEKVAEGVITQEQADKMLEGRKMNSKQADPAAMKEKLEARLTEKVAAGAITQEEADQMLERFQNR